MPGEEFNVFKIEYFWFEGEHKAVLLAKTIDQKGFEKDLLNAKKFAEKLKGIKVKGDSLGKGYVVECLPEYFDQIVWFLTNKCNYIKLFFDTRISYLVEDMCRGNKIFIDKQEKKVETKQLK